MCTNRTNTSYYFERLHLGVKTLFEEGKNKLLSGNSGLHSLEKLSNWREQKKLDRIKTHRFEDIRKGTGQCKITEPRSGRSWKPRKVNLDLWAALLPGPSTNYQRRRLMSWKALWISFLGLEDKIWSLDDVRGLGKFLHFCSEPWISKPWKSEWMEVD